MQKIKDTRPSETKSLSKHTLQGFSSWRWLNMPCFHKVFVTSPPAHQVHAFVRSLLSSPVFPVLSGRICFICSTPAFNPSFHELYCLCTVGHEAYHIACMQHCYQHVSQTALAKHLQYLSHKNQFNFKMKSSNSTVSTKDIESKSSFSGLWKHLAHNAVACMSPCCLPLQPCCQVQAANLTDLACVTVADLLVNQSKHVKPILFPSLWPPTSLLGCWKQQQAGSFP